MSIKFFAREIIYWIIGIVHRIKNRHVIIEHKAKVRFDSILEGYNKFSKYSFFSGKIGYGSYIGDWSNIEGEIGRYCSIAAHVTFLNMTHPVKTFVSTAPCFYSLLCQNGMTYVKDQKFREIYEKENGKYPITIGNDVYIGYGATIIAPATIGDGAVIAAHAVVTGNVEPYTIVGGAPAKPIRKRFSDEDIRFFLDLAWWNKDEEWIKKYADYFDSVERLRKALDEGEQENL